MSRAYNVTITVEREGAPVELTVEGYYDPPTAASGPSYHSGGEPGDGLEITSSEATDDEGNVVALLPGEIERVYAAIGDVEMETDDDGFDEDSWEPAVAVLVMACAWWSAVGHLVMA